jgi:hypothetical protein
MLASTSCYESLSAIGHHNSRGTGIAYECEMIEIGTIGWLIDAALTAATGAALYEDNGSVGVWIVGGVFGASAVHGIVETAICVNRKKPSREYQAIDLPSAKDSKQSKDRPSSNDGNSEPSAEETPRPVSIKFAPRSLPETAKPTTLSPTDPATATTQKCSHVPMVTCPSNYSCRLTDDASEGFCVPDQQ